MAERCRRPWSCVREGQNENGCVPLPVAGWYREGKNEYELDVRVEMTSDCSIFAAGRAGASRGHLPPKSVRCAIDDEEFLDTGNGGYLGFEWI